MARPSDADIIKQARTLYESADIEFDEPKLSRTESGTWVSAWVYVAHDDENDEDE